MRGGVIERAGDAAKRPQIGRRQIGNTARPADHDDGIDVGGEPFADVIEQGTAVQQRTCLVTAEPARSSAGQDRAEDEAADQAALSSRTGTDFAAGTWLCSALCLTDMRMLHSG